MSDTVIKVENLSKQYRLGMVGTGTIAHDLRRWWHIARGKEDPYLKIGESNQRDVKGESDYVWALKDINFEVKRGEVLGIIGKNGAGKSTLLKILSRVTAPTTGTFKVKGRISSLLEVGTGFHPELTGRENIFLNGSILGMSKAEIKSKFDEIVDFSGVERYIDTPVKRYSSGMYVRLAFAVAAHLEPEILIIDEVLSVGDAEFQKKCIGKMKDVAGEGRTVLFVSHNLIAVKSLCPTTLYLKTGSVHFSGKTEEAIEQYYTPQEKNRNQNLISQNLSIIGTGEAKFKELFLLDSLKNCTNDFFYKETIILKIVLEAYENLKNLLFDIRISTQDSIVVAHIMNALDNIGLFSFDKGRNEVTVEIENNFQPGNYTISLGVHNSTDGTPTIDYVENVYNFTVRKISRDDKKNDYNFNFVFGYIRPKTAWSVNIHL